MYDNSVTYTAIIAYYSSLPPHLRVFQKIGDFPSALQFSKCNGEAFAMAELEVCVCVCVFYVRVCDMVAIPVCVQSITNQCIQAVTAQGKLPFLTASPLSSLHQLQLQCLSIFVAPLSNWLLKNNMHCTLSSPANKKPSCL